MLEFFTRKKSAGFTLIELLVVVAIIGLLSSIILVLMGPARGKAKDARRQADFVQIAKAMELYKSDNNDKYLTIAAPGGANAVSSIGIYMTSVPKDPLNVTPNQYTWLVNSGNEASYYCLFTKLEGASNTWLTASHQGVVILGQVAAPATLSTCK